MFGITAPDCYGVIELDSLAAKPVLFVPRYSNMYKIWMTVLTKEDYQTKHGIETHYVDEM